MMPNGSVPRLVITDLAPRICMREGEACAYAQSLPPLNAWQSRIKADISVPDWDPLFSAVKARLRASVDTHVAATASRKSCDQNIDEGLRNCALECAAALDQLHASWVDELDQRRQLELELIEIATKLELANSKLACMPMPATLAKRSSLRDGFGSIRDSWFKFREPRVK